MLQHCAYIHQQSIVYYSIKLKELDMYVTVKMEFLEEGYGTTYPKEFADTSNSADTFRSVSTF